MATFDQPAMLDRPNRSSSELEAQVERILASDSFRGSEVLRRLLSYVAVRAAGSTGPVTVHQIAAEVFGRSKDFDSHNDSVVRAHTGRLRSKLAEYYVNEGSSDDILVSIPKGGYALSWTSRRGQMPPAHEAYPDYYCETPEDHPALPVSRKPWKPGYVLVSAVSSLLTLAVVALLWISVRGQAQPQNLKAFWTGFAEVHEAPSIVVFSHLEPENISTIGEVLGVANVTRALCILQKPPATKSGRFLSWDDAKSSNLIFVGGPFAETPLREFTMFQEFQFHATSPSDALPSNKTDAILNVHPRRGEALAYQRAWPSVPYDYGVIALRPGFSPGHKMLALAGITEYGTIAAADIVSREDLLGLLLARLEVPKGKPVPFFEALCRVGIVGGVPVSPEVLLVHKLK